MPPSIDKNAIQWDVPPTINPGQVQWDAAPSPVELNALKSHANSLDYKMAIAGAKQAESLPQYAGRFVREGALPALGATAGTAIGGVPGAMAGAALGETISQATGLTPAGSVIHEANKPDLGRIAITGAMQGVIPAVAGAVKTAYGAGKSMLNPVAAATLQEGRKAGYVVPPSTVNPSWLNNKLESVAGKAAVGQEAAKRNQAVTNALVKKALGLADDAPLTEGTLQAARKQAGKVYEEVSQLRPTDKMEWFPRYHEKDLVGQLAKAREGARDAWKSANMGNSDARDLARSLEGTAEAIHGDIVDIARANGREDLVKALTQARTKIAKIHDVEKALNLGDENVSAPILGRLLDKSGVAAKSGELKTIGQMAEAFPSVMREGARVPSSGVSGTDAAASALLGTVGYGAAGGPAGMVAAALPLLRSPARSLVLSNPYQNFATSGINPRYQAILDELLKRGTPLTGATASQLANQKN